ncbi:DUF899 family protein [Kribbella sp. NPDC050124]|uniref:DUF899 family protein n=1 Tax=Kribbella sp. NPDC050124 TaxID=3364114 RepID=UPI0037A8661A
MKTPPVVSAEEWNAAREELLRKEKEHTRAKDALAAERRRLPWIRVEKEYTFEGPDGKVGLPDLFCSFAVVSHSPARLMTPVGFP